MTLDERMHPKRWMPNSKRRVWIGMLLLFIAFSVAVIVLRSLPNDRASIPSGWEVASTNGHRQLWAIGDDSIYVANPLETPPLFRPIYQHGHEFPGEVVAAIKLTDQLIVGGSHLDSKDSETRAILWAAKPIEGRLKLLASLDLGILDFRGHFIRLDENTFCFMTGFFSTRESDQNELNCYRIERTLENDFAISMVSNAKIGLAPEMFGFFQASAENVIGVSETTGKLALWRYADRKLENMQWVSDLLPSDRWARNSVDVSPNQELLLHVSAEYLRKREICRVTTSVYSMMNGSKILEENVEESRQRGSKYELAPCGRFVDDRSLIITSVAGIRAFQLTQESQGRWANLELRSKVDFIENDPRYIRFVLGGKEEGFWFVEANIRSQETSLKQYPQLILAKDH